MITKTTYYPLRLHTPTPEEIMHLRKVVMKLSQQKFGDLLYVSYRAVQNWENGKTPMSGKDWKFINEYTTPEAREAAEKSHKAELEEIERQKRYEIRLAKDLKANEYEAIARACRVRGEPLPFTEEEQAWIREHEFDYILDWEVL